MSFENKIREKDEQLGLTLLILLIRSVMLQEWNDANLKWNASEYGNVVDVRIPPKHIWLPDLLMYNR